VSAPPSRRWTPFWKPVREDDFDREERELEETSDPRRVAACHCSTCFLGLQDSRYAPPERRAYYGPPAKNWNIYCRSCFQQITGSDTMDTPYDNAPRDKNWYRENLYQRIKITGTGGDRRQAAVDAFARQKAARDALVFGVTKAPEKKKGRKKA
jgi:hypothetical protein